MTALVLVVVFKLFEGFFSLQINRSGSKKLDFHDSISIVVVVTLCLSLSSSVRYLSLVTAFEREKSTFGDAATKSESSFVVFLMLAHSKVNGLAKVS